MRLTTAVSAAALALAACVNNPWSGTAVAPGSTSVSFAGWEYLDLAGERVRVEVEEPDGSWTALAEGPVNGFNTWWATVQVPDRAWRHPPCAAARFRFTNTASSSRLFGFDAACLDPAGPDATLLDGALCMVQTVDIFRGQEHVGDLAITGQAQADQHACVTVVRGNLSITGGRTPGPQGSHVPGVTLTMTNLSEVTGNLTLDNGRTTAFRLPRLARVGGALEMLSTQFLALSTPPGGPTTADDAVTTFDLRRLATVGGSVSLRNAEDGGLGGATLHDFGLDGLNDVGGDVRIQASVFPSRIVGLRGLSELRGNLVIDLGATDANDPELLPFLERVGGGLSITANPNAKELLRSLRSVGRNLSINAYTLFVGLWPGFLPVLETVGGEVLFPAVWLPCDRTALPSLRSVGGMLRLTGGRPEGTIGSSGVTPLVLGGLLMSDTAAAFVPLPPDTSVTGSGPVIVTKNPNLCLCQVGAVAAGFTARGWTGVLQQGGNGGAASCGTCPSPICP